MQLELLWRIFLAFAKVGVFGYGGGPSMIPLVKREVVDTYGWFTAQDFADTLAIGNALPGPIATKMSAYIGFKLAGIPGAIAGVLGTILPSLVVMLAFAALLLANKDAPAIKGALRAARPVVIALLIWTVYDIWPNSINARWDAVLIAIVAFAVVTLLKVHPAIVVFAAAVLGAMLYR